MAASASCDRLWTVMALALAMALVGSCAPSPPAPSAPPAAGGTRWLLVGLDGGEWKVVERLWAEGRMPHLQALAERGSRAVLRSDYAKSPVIWTTIATGVRPAAHGIEDFVAATPTGDVPISSDQRRVPALWNMLSSARRRVAVVGWWATWPAEEVNGVVVSDRAAVPGLARRVFPTAVEPRFAALWAATDETAWPEARGGQEGRRDAVHAALGEAMAGEGYDLLMVYLRTPDLVSHPYWRYFEPGAFPPLPAGELESNAKRIPAVYEAVDQALGRLVAAAGPQANVLVVSDHGFRAAAEDGIKNPWDLDALLATLGFQQRRGPPGRQEVEMAGTRLFTYGSDDGFAAKKVRCARRGRDAGGSLDEAACAAARRDLEAALGRVTDRDGGRLMTLRPPRGNERREGADFVVRLHPTPRAEAFLDSQPLAGVVLGVERLSGEHRADTHGLLVAAGPDVARGADLDGISIFDVTPTVLFGLGLPVAADFAGRPWTALFTEDFQRVSPLRQIASWGVRQTAAAEPAAGDAEALHELRALGYLQ